MGGHSQSLEPAALPGLGTTLATSLVSLALVCLLAYLALRWLARRGGALGARPRAGAIRVLERVQLEPRRALYLIQVGPRGLLIGVGEGAMSLLAEVPEETVRELEVQASNAGSAGASRFGAVLARVLARAPGKPSATAAPETPAGAPGDRR